MHEHVLAGCTSRPLANYLKAIGILRVVGEQVDCNIQGWWSDGCFQCKTSLDVSSLEDFFVRDYAPTPIVAPWNGGSGFFPGDAQDGIKAIEQSAVSRLSAYREVIAQVRSWPEMGGMPTTLLGLIEVLSKTALSAKGKTLVALNELLESINGQVVLSQSTLGDILPFTLEEIESRAVGRDTTKDKAWGDFWKVVKKARTLILQLGRSCDKNDLLTICRAKLPDSCLSWLDSAYVLDSEGDASYSAILGTGGNEGRLDYSNNFMQQVAGLFIRTDEETRRSWWRSAVFGELSDCLSKGSIGQYDPGRAGGFNQGMGIEKKDFKISPWDYILMLEGAVMFASALVRRNSSDYRGSLSSPFSVHFSPVGFTSSDQAESGRGEIWLPLWENPAELAELKHLFAEGRGSLARKQVRTGMDFMRAVGLLGVDRGITAFERFAFLKRRGQSYVALPAGRMPVAYRPELELLGDLDKPIQSIDRFLREFKTVPASFSRSRRLLDEALFACSSGPSIRAFGAVLRAMGQLDYLISTRDRAKKPVFPKPLFGLATQWLEACDDGSLEVRLAAALTSIKSSGGVGSFRSSIAPVNPSKPWAWASGKGQAEWVGNSLSERLGGVLIRRLMDAERTSALSAPFSGAVVLAPEDVVAFAMGRFDQEALEELLWGFSLIDFRKRVPQAVQTRWVAPVQQILLPREWCLLKLMHSPHQVRKKTMRFEPRISRLLVAGRVQEACEIATHRLLVAGLTSFKASYDSILDPTGLLASLLIPTSKQYLLEDAVLLPLEKTN